MINDVNLKDIVNINKLQKLQDAFSQVTGIATVTVDLEGNHITKPSEFTDFCVKYNRGSIKGKKRCEECDAKITEPCHCYADLKIFSEPIVLDGKKIASIVGGQVLTTEPDENKFRKLAQELDVPVDDYLNALHKVPIRSEEYITSSILILSQLINSFIYSEYYMENNVERLETLETEVKNVLDDTQSISTHTQELRHISKRQNILALNASIEAGRAGEAGKGFSVVAQQMSVLSKQSSDIYSSITTYAKNIDKSIRKLDILFNDNHNED